MVKKGLLVVLVLCIGLVLAACPKKAVVKEEPSAKAAAALAAEKEKAAKVDAERREKEAREAKIREEEARKKVEAEAAAKREGEKGLVAKTTPGIEGTEYVTSQLKDVYFDFDRYDVRPGDAEILKQNATVITKNPAWKIQIEGHCDERGTAEYNLALGERRASSVKKYLVALGIPQGRISTISYGEERPFDRGKSEEAWGKNRKAHFIILSK